MNMRINKLLANAGLGSRREVEELIVSGQVKINGIQAELSDLVEPDDEVTVNGGDLPVAELIAQYNAEQKQLLYEQAVGLRIAGEDYFDDEDYEDGQRRGRGSSFKRGGEARRSSEPAKFKKFINEEEPMNSYGGKRRRDSSPSKPSKRPRRAQFDSEIQSYGSDYSEHTSDRRENFGGNRKPTFQKRERQADSYRYNEEGGYAPTDHSRRNKESFSDEGKTDIVRKNNKYRNNRYSHDEEGGRRSSNPYRGGEERRSRNTRSNDDRRSGYRSGNRNYDDHGAARRGGNKQDGGRRSGNR